MRRQFELRDHEQRVAIEQLVYESLTTAALAAKKQETGGILIGRYIDGVAVIESATVAPRDSKQGYDWFERGTHGLATILKEHWDAPTRRYYLGEWHFHPAPDGSPSWQDADQMFRVASDDRYDCGQPVLIIVSPHEEALLFRVFLVVDGSLNELVASSRPAHDPTD
jgi:integrative and conjugative element protein (TIGR02256 family)